MSFEGRRGWRESGFRGRSSLASGKRKKLPRYQKHSHKTCKLSSSSSAFLAVSFPVNLISIMSWALRVNLDCLLMFFCFNYETCSKIFCFLLYVNFISFLLIVRILKSSSICILIRWNQMKESEIFNDIRNDVKSHWWCNFLAKENLIK